MTPALVTELPPHMSPENVLHTLAHEIRQPLGAIESIAYYLSLVLPGDVAHRAQLARIQQLVEQSNWILCNGLGLSDNRRAAAQPVDLEDLIARTIAARPPSVDPPLHCEFTAGLPLAHLDPGFGRALIENILTLFRHLASDAYPARIRTSAASPGIEIEVSTAAPGYRSVASLPAGSALSLDCAQRMAALHGGSCACSIDPESGIRVRVMLP